MDFVDLDNIILLNIIIVCNVTHNRDENRDLHSQKKRRFCSVVCVTSLRMSNSYIEMAR